MTRDERGELLRKRLDAVRGYKLAPLQATPKPDTEPRRGFFQNRIQMTTPGTVKEMNADWIGAPDAKPKPVPKPDRRRKGLTALERIAAYYPVRKG
jgi:hypothetical protein